MADGISFRMVTEPFTKAIATREARMPAGARFAVRQAGRVATKAARAKAPVLGDKTVISHAAAKKLAKTGTATSGPVRGALRASIAPSKNLTRDSPAGYSLKVGPRGPRAHLYAQKEEARAGYMAAGEAAAKAAMPAIAAAAFNRVWVER